MHPIPFFELEIFDFVEGTISRNNGYIHRELTDDTTETNSCNIVGGQTVVAVCPNNTAIRLAVPRPQRGPGASNDRFPFRYPFAPPPTGSSAATSIVGNS